MRKRLYLLALAGALCAAGCARPAAVAPLPQLTDSRVAGADGDAGVGRAVRAALESDPELKGLGIEVRVAGGRVSLHGALSDAALRTRAADRARSVPDVLDVNVDSLALRPAGGHGGGK